MKTTYLLILSFFAIHSFAQIGINTTTPNAQLEIKATNQATPSNTDGIIIPKIDAFPVTNPTVAQQGMMVYLTTTSAGKLPGFYYWDTTSWIGINSTINADTDWYKVGGTTTPNNTDNMYHFGKVGIGTSLTPASTLELVGTGITNTASVSTTGETIGFKNTINGSGTGRSFGEYTTIGGNHAELSVGNYIKINATNNIYEHDGIWVDMTNVNTTNNNRNGVQIRMSGTATNGNHIGFNTDIQTDNTFGIKVGLQNSFGGIGNNVGVRNVFSAGTNGTGISNGFAGNVPGLGVYNAMASITPNPQFGIYNNYSSPSTGVNNGVYNAMPYGLGTEYGTYNDMRNFSTTLTGAKYGTFTQIEGTATNTGNKYGSYTSILNTTGGIHYGVYADVIKTGSYAGYFLGNVAIGTTTTNNYILPASRGTANQIMQTDGIGNVSWNNSTTLTTNEWHTTGNSSTISGTNFIGTINAQDVDFRSANTIKLRLSQKGQLETLNTGNSIFIGEQAGEVDDLSNNKNNFIGYQNGFSTTTGESNNTIGYQAFYSNVNGNNNIAIGNQALYSNNNGSNNIAHGYQSMFNNTTGSNNIANGFQAMFTNTGGEQNIAMGSLTLNKNTIGNYNIAMGSSTLNKNTTGSSNIGIGYAALSQNTSGGLNTAIGERSSLNNTTGIGNSSYGAYSLQQKTTGNYNTAIGTQSMENFVSGNYNTAIGLQSMSQSTGGDYNTAIGSESLRKNTTGLGNVAIGRLTLSENTTGNYNIGIGFQNLTVLTSGYQNTAIGHIAGSSITTGIQNTTIGYASGNLLSTGSNNIAVGGLSNVPNSAGDYQLSIANVIYGSNMSTTALGKIGIGEPNPTEKLDIAGNLKVSGAIMPNNLAGIAGQVLTSAGPGLAPTWTSSSTQKFTTTGASLGIYNVALTEYTVRVFNGVSEIRLPNAVGNQGKIFVIIGSNGIGAKLFSTAGGVIYDDVTNTAPTYINPNERYMLQSDGTDWIVIGR